MGSNSNRSTMKPYPVITENMTHSGADKSLARPDWKKQLKGRHFSSNADVIAAAQIWLDGQPSEFFLSALQKLGFGCYSLFPSWSRLRTYQHPGIWILMYTQKGGHVDKYHKAPPSDHLEPPAKRQSITSQKRHESSLARKSQILH